jgi:MFS family permease
MNPRRLFIASCIALVTTAMAFAIRGDVMDSMGNTFSLDKEQIGWVGSAAFLGFAISILLGSPLCDFLGMHVLLSAACLLHISGVLLTIFAPGFSLLFLATLLIGFGNGLVEAVINPLIATMYPKEKTHMLNTLHAWWPGGQIIAGVLAFMLTRTLTPDPATATLDQMTYAWQVKMALIILSAIVYGVLIIGQRFPATERVSSNISTSEMLAEAFNPAFILWFCLMWLTAATELGPMQWVPDVLTKSTGTAGAGILVLVYINLIMFVMRYFAGPLVHRLSALGLLTISSILSAIGLLALSATSSVIMVFAAATVFATGICYFWPTMLGITSERFPRGGALLLGMMGTAGNLSIFFVLPFIGSLYDTQTQAALPAGKEVTALIQTIDKGSQKTASAEEVKAKDEAKTTLEAARTIGAPLTFRKMAQAPMALTVIFAILWSFGGYKQIHLTAEEEVAADAYR